MAPPLQRSLGAESTAALAGGQPFFGRLDAAQSGVAAMPNAPEPDRGLRLAGIGLVVLAHSFVLWILLAGGLTRYAETSTHEIEATLIPAQTRPAQSPSPTPQLQSPEMDVVAAPDIQIAEIPGPDAIAGVDKLAMSQALAPRPDPAHRNEGPELPAGLRAGGPPVVLRVLVLPDGSVADAQVTKSSGQPKLDAFAMDFAKEHWRFLPALLGGRPIQYWTTVMMRFGKG